MERTGLDTVVLDGIDNVNFFNGRVLTAEDLRDQQTAEAEHHRRLGRAIGPGIVSGLDVGVGSDRRSVEVAPGLAIDVLGDVLEVTEPGVEVGLAVTVAGSGDAGGGTFAPCTTVTSTPVTSGDGIYLLVVAPAAGQRGRAAAVGFGASGAAADCGARYTVEGVLFRLVSVDIEGLYARSELDEDALTALRAVPGSPERRRTRNVLAHLLLDTALERTANLAPFGSRPEGAFAALRALGRLTPCDVPLAVLSWSGGRIEFLDRYAVRRRPVPDAAAGPAWQAFMGPRGPALRTAVLEQFQDQLAELGGVAAFRRVRLGPRPFKRPLRIPVQQQFRFLPAAGMLLEGIGTQSGVLVDAFLADVPTNGPLPMDPAQLEAFLRQSLAHPPIDLATGEVIRLYELVRPGGQSDARVVAFGSSRLPWARHPRLELWAVTPARPLIVDETIRLHGRGFTASSDQPDVEMRADVEIGGIPVEVGLGTDLELEVQVPDVQPPPEGVRVDIVVRNAHGEDAATVRVLPSSASSGTLQITRDSVELDPQGQTTTVVYTVTTEGIVTGVELEAQAEVEDADGPRPVDVVLSRDAIDEVNNDMPVSVVATVDADRETVGRLRLQLSASSGAIEAIDVLEPEPDE